MQTKESSYAVAESQMAQRKFCLRYPSSDSTDLNQSFSATTTIKGVTVLFYRLASTLFDAPCIVHSFLPTALNDEVSHFTR